MHLFSESAPSLSSVLGLMTTVVIAAWYDWTSWRIPNALLAASAAASLMLATFATDGIGLSSSLAGGLTGLGLFLPVYMLRRMGAGDVKLLATLGLFGGPLLCIDIALMSSLAGGVWALIYLFLQTRHGQQLRFAAQAVLGTNFVRLSSQVPAPTLDGKQGAMMPYGLVIAIGTLAALLIAMH